MVVNLLCSEVVVVCVSLLVVSMMLFGLVWLNVCVVLSMNDML